MRFDRRQTYQAECADWYFVCIPHWNWISSHGVNWLDIMLITSFCIPARRSSFLHFDFTERTNLVPIVTGDCQFSAQSFTAINSTIPKCNTISDNILHFPPSVPFLPLSFILIFISFSSAILVSAGYADAAGSAHLLPVRQIRHGTAQQETAHRSHQRAGDDRAGPARTGPLRGRHRQRQKGQHHKPGHFLLDVGRGKCRLHVNVVAF